MIVLLIFVFSILICTHTHIHIYIRLAVVGMSLTSSCMQQIDFTVHKQGNVLLRYGHTQKGFICYDHVWRKKISHLSEYGNVFFVEHVPYFHTFIPSSSTPSLHDKFA